jgi:PAP2 superfamily
MSVPQPSPRVRSAIREVVLVAALFLAYKIGRLAADGHVSDALSNAQAIWGLERAVHLPSEAGVQGAIIHHRSLVHAANMYYAFVHFPATIASLVWLYLRRPAYYTWTRRVLACLTATALVLHLLLPLAPPRMLLDIGMVDTGAVYGPSVYGPPDTDTLANQFAAMPSLHVGWALAVAIGLITATRSRWRWAWLAHPIITLLVVVATGNHYWLDALAAGGLLALVFAVMPRPVVADRERQPAGVRGSGPPG